MKIYRQLLLLAMAAFSCSPSKPDSPIIIQPGSHTPQDGGDEGEEGSAQANSGKLPAWQKGCLDIHFINSGRGECAFFIYPDGTQMLLDCGGSIMKYDSGTNLGLPQVGIYPKPDDSQVAGHWYTCYIRKCMEWTGNNRIDYALNTHFDGDHLGVGYANYGVTPPTSPYGKWYQTGFTYVLDNLTVGKMIDRGYPSYDYPYAQEGTVKTNCDNYRKCCDYHEGKGELKRERFIAGSSSQLAMTRDAASYPDFKVQNIFVNGTIWTGKGSETRELFPPVSEMSGTGAAKEKSPSENSCSCVIKLSYGDFDYYGGGDAGFNGAANFSWKHVEKNTAAVVGPVEVLKATHHGSADGCSQELLDGLKPSDIIVNVWQAVQPRAVTYERMIASGARIFTTNINADYEKEYSDKGQHITGTGGHIVVRVNPGGKSYCIYRLDDTDKSMSMKILKAYGPYKCR